MKSKEYLKSKGLKNPPLDSGISGGGDAPRQYTLIVMESYAQQKALQLIEELEKPINNTHKSGIKYAITKIKTIFEIK